MSLTLSSPDDSPTALRRKREIADAARAELMEKGVEGLRMRAIAKRAGINIATLHYHANGKEGLIGLVAASIADDFMEQRNRTPRDDWSGLKQLIQELKDFRALRNERPDIHPLMASLSRRAPSDPNIAQFITPMNAAWERKLQTIMARGRSDGSLRASLDPLAAAQLYIFTVIAVGSHGRDPNEFAVIACELLRAFASDPNQDFERLLDDFDR
ncbi:MAG: TetR/AcrR family transcriptional regulator [Paracoccaceae bacterium]